MASTADIVSFMATDFPQCNSIIEDTGNSGATVRHKIGVNELRPGGTVSGPVMMGVADVALYAAILGEIGIVPLAVTTNLIPIKTALEMTGLCSARMRLPMVPADEQQLGTIRAALERLELPVGA